MNLIRITKGKGASQEPERLYSLQPWLRTMLDIDEESNGYLVFQEEVKLIKSNTVAHLAAWLKSLPDKAFITFVVNKKHARANAVLIASWADKTALYWFEHYKEIDEG